MSVGQIISDTFGAVKDRFGQLLGLWAIYFAITIGASIAFANVDNGAISVCCTAA